MAARHAVHAGGRIVVFNDYCPWKGHLLDIEAEAAAAAAGAGAEVAEDTSVLYALFPDSSGSW